MAQLTVRNLTLTPLELKALERIEATPARKGIAKISGNITSLFNSTSTTDLVPKTDQATPPPLDKTTLDGIIAGPFETRKTNIPTADPSRREVLRLTFQTPGTEYRYEVTIPGPSSRSTVMKRLNNAPAELTAIYSGKSSCIAIFSSANLSTWMKELRDEYPLSMLSIPGTHNSPTCHVALPSVRCQAVPVKEQLNNGVRFLDIRVSVNADNDTLTLVHSAFPISLTGNKYFQQDLLDVLYAFLDANPSECLIVSIKREGTGKGTDQQLSRYLHDRYTSGSSARRWFTDPRIPTLGEARGKIILVRRHNLDDSLRGEHDGKGWGIDAAGWPDNCADGVVQPSGLIRVQDFYEIDQSTNIEKKIGLAQSHLARACQSVFVVPALAGGNVAAAQAASTPGLPPFFVNFLSASNFFRSNCWPEKIAAKVNPAVIEYLCVRHADAGSGEAQMSVGEAGTGIVVTDWVGLDGDWDLIRCIVGWNARLQLQK